MFQIEDNFVKNRLGNGKKIYACVCGKLYGTFQFSKEFYPNFKIKKIDKYNIIWDIDTYP